MLTLLIPDRGRASEHESRDDAHGAVTGMGCSEIGLEALDSESDSLTGSLRVRLRLARPGGQIQKGMPPSLHWNATRACDRDQLVVRGDMCFRTPCDRSTLPLVWSILPVILLKSISESVTGHTE